MLELNEARKVPNEFISVDNGTSVPSQVLSQDPWIIGYGTIKTIEIMDDQDMDYIHFNNAARPKEVQLPLFPNPITTGLKNE